MPFAIFFNRNIAVFFFEFYIPSRSLTAARTENGTLEAWTFLSWKTIIFRWTMFNFWEGNLLETIYNILYIIYYILYIIYYILYIIYYILYIIYYILYIIYYILYIIYYILYIYHISFSTVPWRWKFFQPLPNPGFGRRCDRVLWEG